MRPPPAKSADAESERFEPETAALLAAAVFHSFGGTQLQNSSAARFFRRHVGGYVRRDLALEVVAQLFVYFLLPLFSPGPPLP